MYALYDIDGILRFTGANPEACEAYAELLEISSDDYCLIDMPGSSLLEINDHFQKIHRRQAMNNN